MYRYLSIDIYLYIDIYTYVHIHIDIYMYIRYIYIYKCVYIFKYLFSGKSRILLIYNKNKMLVEIIAVFFPLN